MARIRTIKPDFWTDEKVVTLSPLARLLFIGMWNFVDDEGRAEFSPLRLKMQILPADTADVSELLGEIRGAGLITVYAVDGKEYLQVRGFAKHQKVDKRTPSRLPSPPNSADLPPHPPNSPEPPRIVPTEREEEGDQGMEGKEKREPDGSPKKDDPDFEAIASEWNALASEFSLPQISKLSLERKAAVRARIKEHGEDCIRRAFIRIRAGPWLQGEGGWRASFDWVFGPRNFRKVIEGNYDQKGGNHGKRQATDAYGNLLRGFAAAAGAEAPDADAEPDEAGACGETISGVQFRVVN